MSEPSTREAPSGGRAMTAGWIAVAIFTVLYLVAYLDRAVINLLIDDIRHDLHLSDVQMSLLQGLAFVVSFALCGLPVGWAIDRYPRRWIVFIGVIIWSLAAISAGLARNFGQLLAARCGVGAGEASLQPAAYSIFADIFPKDRLAVPIGVFSTGAIMGMGVSLALGGLIAGWARGHGAIILPVVGLLQPWQFVLVITGLPGLVLGALVFLVSEPVRAAPKGVAAGGSTGLLAQLGRHRAFYIYHSLGFACLGVVGHGWNNWAPTFLVRTLGWEIPRVGLTLGFFSMVGALIGQLSAAALADALFRKGVRDAHMRIYVFCGLLAAIAGLVTVAAGLAGVTWLMCGAIMFIHAAVTLVAVAAATLQIVTPAHLRGRVSTLFLLIHNLVGYGFGPLAVASFTQYLFHDSNKIGLGLACSFAIFGPLAALFLFLGLKPMRRAVDQGAA